MPCPVNNRPIDVPVVAFVGFDKPHTTPYGDK